MLLGLVLWDALNVLLLWYAVRRLLPGNVGNLALALMYLEVLRTTERAQSNALVAALMILAFVWFEEERAFRAVVAVVAGVCIKLFPVLAILPALFHPRRLRTSVLGVISGIVALLLPLTVVSWPGLVQQYQSWYRVEELDAVADLTGGAAGLYGGAMHWVRVVLGVDWANWQIQLAGLFLLLAPLVRVDQWRDRRFRLRVLASILVFCTIFNHQVESPSFVIAVAGIGIWFAISERRALDVALIVAVIVLVSLTSNDIMPRALRVLAAEYKVKTLPCLAVWLVQQAELLGVRRWSRADSTLAQTSA